MASWQTVAMHRFLTPISRPEQVVADKTYSILGAHWYAKGLYVKDVRTGGEIQAKTLYRVCEGDFVYNRLFAWKGSFAIADCSCDGCYVSNEFPCFNVDLDIADPHFIWRFFGFTSTWDVALGSSSGSTPTSRNRLKEQMLLSMELPLPPLPEQKRIVARIVELAAKIEEARRLRCEAQQELNDLVVSLHLRLSKHTVRLGDIIYLDEERENVSPCRLYPQVGVRGFGKGLFPRETLDAAQTSYKAFNVLYDGALVLSQVKGWEGAVAVCDSSLAGKYVSPEYRTFRCIPAMADPSYLRILVATPWFFKKLSTLSRGVGARRERTRPEQFVELELPMPDVNSQRQALEVLGRIDALSALQASANRELDALLPSILDKAFKGEL